MPASSNQRWALEVPDVVALLILSGDWADHYAVTGT
jgi:hypothetical protein